MAIGEAITGGFVFRIPGSAISIAFQNPRLQS